MSPLFCAAWCCNSKACARPSRQIADRLLCLVDRSHLGGLECPRLGWLLLAACDCDKALAVFADSVGLSTEGISYSLLAAVAFALQHEIIDTSIVSPPAL
jgi:hypothetical protein